MKRKEYDHYVKRVTEFFDAEGITNLSRIDHESHPYFSWRPCDCCLRPLGGDRIEASGYNPTTKEIQEYSICVDCEYFAEYGRLDDMTMVDLDKG